MKHGGYRIDARNRLSGRSEKLRRRRRRRRRRPAAVVSRRPSDASSPHVRASRVWYTARARARRRAVGMRGCRPIGRVSVRPSGAESKARVRPEPVRRTDIVSLMCRRHVCTYTGSRRVPNEISITINALKRGKNRKRF